MVRCKGGEDLETPCHVLVLRRAQDEVYFCFSSFDLSLIVMPVQAGAHP